MNVKLNKYKMKKNLFFLLLVAAMLSSCEVLNNVAGSEIANAISENLTEQITSRTNVDPDAVAAAANSLASALTISNNEIIALCEEHMMEMDTINYVLRNSLDPLVLRGARALRAEAVDEQRVAARRPPALGSQGHVEVQELG